jgi:hypothetical protein
LPAATPFRSAVTALRLAEAIVRFAAWRTRDPAADAFRPMRRGPEPVASRRAFFTVAATVPSVVPIVRATSTSGPSALLDALLIQCSLVGIDLLPKSNQETAHLDAASGFVESSFAGIRCGFDLLARVARGFLRAPGPSLPLSPGTVHAASSRVGDVVARFLARPGRKKDAERCSNGNTDCKHSDCFRPSIS